jgi:hypothetical protein
MVRVILFNATFNNISVILWRSVLLVEETGVSRENHGLAISHCYFVFTTKIINFYSKLVPDQKWNIQRRKTTNTDCISSCKTSYLTIKATYLNYMQEIYTVHPKRQPYYLYLYVSHDWSTTFDSKQICPSKAW